MTMRICDCPRDWHLAGDPACERICGGIAGGDGGGGISPRALLFAALFSLPIWAVIAFALYLGVTK